MIATLYLHSPQRRVAGMKLEPLYYMRSRTSVLVLGYSEDTSDFMRQNMGTVPVSCTLCARVGYQYSSMACLTELAVQHAKTPQSVEKYGYNTRLWHKGWKYDDNDKARQSSSAQYN